MLANSVARSQVWKRLWKLHVSGKIKIFGWRVLHGFIPCQAVLTNEHISATSGCPMCQHGAKDIKHLLFTCDRAKAVWSAVGIWGMISSLVSTNRSGSIILEEIIRREETGSLDIGMAELVLVGSWYIYLVGEATTHPW
jgi:hypothetical protein